MIDFAGIRIFQGNTIACERTEGVNNNMSQSHYHDFYELYYLESGQRYLMVQDELFEIRGGQFVLFAPYVMHRSYGDPDVPFKRIVVYFQPAEVCSESLQHSLSYDNGIHLTEIQDCISIHSLLEMLLSEEQSSSDFKREYMHTILNLILLNMQRQFNPPAVPEQQTPIGQVIDYIHKHYSEKITLEALSNRFYISQYHLCREFKRHTNCTIIQYINLTRIMNAQRRLMETSKSMTEVADITGFTNLTHFNRVFRSITGMSPSEYKKAVIPGI